VNAVISSKTSTTGLNHITNLNQAKVVVRKSTFMCHGWTKVVDVKLVSVTNRLRSMMPRIRFMQHAEANYPYWRRDRLYSVP